MANEVKMTKSAALAWRIYEARVRALMERQLREFADVQRAAELRIAPPTREHVEIARAALFDAFREGGITAVKAALDPIVAALDQIDNDGGKGAARATARAHVQRAYEALHVLRDSVLNAEPPQDFDVASDSSK